MSTNAPHIIQRNRQYIHTWTSTLYIIRLVYLAHPFLLLMTYPSFTLLCYLLPLFFIRIFDMIPTSTLFLGSLSPPQILNPVSGITTVFKNFVIVERGVGIVHDFGYE